MKRTLRPADIAAIRSAAFVARCTGAAVLAYLAAVQVGLGHPVWAVVSALIVSQETAAETRRSFLWRVAGTLTGAAVAVACAWLLLSDPSRPMPATALAIVISATIARRWPSLRVAMWTSALVILTATTGHSIVHTAIQRAGEVLVGGIIGALTHLLLDRAVIGRLEQQRPDQA